MGRSFRKFAIAGAAGFWACAGTAIAAPIYSTGDPALAGASLETFNSAPLSGFVTYTINDITVQSAVQFSFQTGGSGQYVPPNPSGDVFLLDSSGLMTFSFASDVQAFGILVGATNFVQTLRAYDSGDNLIEAVSIPNQVGTLPFPYSGFYGIASSAADIAYFTITDFADGVVFDDLYYTAGAAIPEPGMIVLLGLGLAGLACARRRRA